MTDTPIPADFNRRGFLRKAAAVGAMVPPLCVPQLAMPTRRRFAINFWVFGWSGISYAFALLHWEKVDDQFKSELLK